MKKQKQTELQQQQEQDEQNSKIENNDINEIELPEESLLELKQILLGDEEDKTPDFLPEVTLVIPNQQSPQEQQKYLILISTQNYYILDIDGSGARFPHTQQTKHLKPGDKTFKPITNTNINQEKKEEQ